PLLPRRARPSGRWPPGRQSRPPAASRCAQLDAPPPTKPISYAGPPDIGMIGSANGARIGITGLGVHVPERVVTNDDLAQYVETSDEWIVWRKGSAQRRTIQD